MFKSFVKFFLGKKHGQTLFRILFFLSLKGMNFGGGADFGESGEEWVIKHFAGQVNSKKPLVLFDVGANKGEYALAAAGFLDSAGADFQIFCFEPSKSTFGLLEKSVAGRPRVKCFNIALGDRQEESVLYADRQGSGLASLYDRDLKFRGVTMARQEIVKVESLENFCQKWNIEKIDFLKLDVEGNEFKVLLGAKNLLEAKLIRFIQFEFGGTDIDARVFFRDFFNLLSPNYALHRILKNGLQPIEKYNEINEIFLTTNYLAVLK